MPAVLAVVALVVAVLAGAFALLAWRDARRALRSAHGAQAREPAPRLDATKPDVRSPTDPDVLDRLDALERRALEAGLASGGAAAPAASAPTPAARPGAWRAFP